MKKFIIIIGIICLGLSNVLAQTVQVSGTITSADDGQPLPGASVIIKGTTHGTVTDIEGKYTLDVPANAVLHISFVGMTAQERVVGTSRVIDVVLEIGRQEISEVVVTALGISSARKSLGYAAQDVKGDKLTQASNTNMITALQGKVAGVDIKPSSGMPGASSQIVIRGARSFTGDNTPLYVVDGMPISSTSNFQAGFGGSLGYGGDGVSGSDISNRAIDIDPNEIESINILKGQAASALYGIRASNGVIIITTKTGKGLPKGKPVISVAVSSSMEKLSRNPDFQNTWAQGAYGIYGLSPAGSMSWGPKVEDLPNDPIYGGNTKNEYTEKATGDTKGKYYVPQRAQAGLDPWAVPQKYDNINDYFLTGYTVNTSLNVSQALETGNYSFGLGNTNQSGIIPSTGMNRTSAKAAAETSFGKAWKTGFTANFVYNSIDKMPGANDGLLGAVYPAPISYDLKGTPTHYPGDPYRQINYRGGSFLNPYWNADNNEFNEKTSRFFGNGFVEFTPQLDWSDDKSLKFRYQLGADTYTTNFQDIWEYGAKGGLGQVQNYGLTNSTYNSLLTATYDMTFAEDFKFTAMLGNEFNHENRKMYSETGTNLNFGGWKHISNTTVQVADERQEQYRTVGFFGSLALSYKSMVYLNVTGREDFVSDMPRGSRSYFYPSVSLGFVASELDVIKNQDIISFLKLRASYAEVGQAGDYMNNYFAKPSYGGSWWSGGDPIQYPIGGISSYIPNNTIYDPDLTPQNTRSYEFGVDIRFLDNLFGIDYTYSRQNVKDQIFDVPLTGSSGVGYLVMNGGKVHTNAHEIVVFVNPIRNKEIDWNIGVNFSKIDNYVDALADGVESIMLGGFVTPQVRAGIGEKFPVIYGTSFARDDQGRILVDENPKSQYYGMPMSGEPAVIGRVAPDFIMGANTSFRYKRLFLDATFEWKNGGQMYSGTNGLGYTYGTAKVTEDRSTPFIYKGYKADGTPNDIQRGGEGDPDAYQYLYSDVLGNVDEAYIFDNSFIKMRELVVGYNIPKLGAFDMKVSLFARNILLWTKLPSLDPESSQGNTNMGGAFERFSMPQTSSYGISLNVVF